MSAQDQKTHLDLPSDISVFWKSGLEDISGNPSGRPLTPLDLLTVPLHPWPRVTLQLTRFSPLAARRLRSYPRLGRSRGPLPDLRGWREQLCVCGGTVQRLSARRRYITKTLEHYSSRLINFLLGAAATEFPAHIDHIDKDFVCPEFIGGGEEWFKVDLEQSPLSWESD